jgi:hypothetical protein
MASNPMSSIRVLPRALWTLFLLATLAFIATPSRATVTFIGSGPGNNSDETNSASVTFNLFVSGTITNLEVSLSNTATYKPNDPADILTALFFRIDGDPSLIRGSAVLDGGSMVVNIGANPQPAGGVVGGEWAYSAELTHAPSGANQGISATGFNLFGPHDLFPGDRLPNDGGSPPDGVAYGLTTPVDDGSRYNGGLLGRALIQSGVVFTLFDVPGDFRLSDISDVTAQYGTSLNGPQLSLETIPEPNTVALTAIGVVLLGLLNRKRR